MFIGTNSSDRSEEGQAIVTLFDRFMSGKRLIIDKTYSIYRYINQRHKQNFRQTYRIGSDYRKLLWKSPRILYLISNRRTSVNLCVKAEAFQSLQFGSNFYWQYCNFQALSHVSAVQPVYLHEHIFYAYARNRFIMLKENMYIFIYFCSDFYGSDWIGISLVPKCYFKIYIFMSDI